MHTKSNVENAFQEKNDVLAVFFALSRAFDKAWKKDLLLTLLAPGVRNKMCMWIRYFLFHRSSRVKRDGFLNKGVTLRERVPQGRVLSPTLFLVYINEIVTTITR